MPGEKDKADKLVKARKGRPLVEIDQTSRYLGQFHDGVCSAVVADWMASNIGGSLNKTNGMVAFQKRVRNEFRRRRQVWR